MFPSLDPKKMQALMKQMGIQQEEVDSSKVIIERSSGGRIIIDNPTVAKITMQGQDSWQISGQEREETGFSDEDIERIVSQTGCSRAEAKRALESTGDMAEAIIKLSP
ncbi:MAG: nascent polypeptide-associated complex protein [Nanoarchaeota archaeon]